MNKKILVVDDEPGTIKVLSARLEAHNFDVTSASNGREGLEMVKNERPDLIILDIMMPIMSGAEMASVLQRDKLTAKIPIIFLSAIQSKEEEKNAGNIIGGQVIFAKPCNIDILINKINEMLA